MTIQVRKLDRSTEQSTGFEDLLAEIEFSMPISVIYNNDFMVDSSETILEYVLMMHAQPSAINLKRNSIGEKSEIQKEISDFIKSKPVIKFINTAIKENLIIREV